MPKRGDEIRKKQRRNNNMQEEKSQGVGQDKILELNEIFIHEKLNK